MSFNDPRLNRRHEQAMVDLGHWIRNRRQLLGITQEELAEAADVSQRYVSRFELGHIRSLPNAATLGRLAAVLDCTVTDLLVIAGYVEGEAKPAEPEEADDVQVFTSIMRDVNRLRGISPHDRAVMQTVIDYVRKVSSEDEP